MSLTDSVSDVGGLPQGLSLGMWLVDPKQNGFSVERLSPMLICGGLKLLSTRTIRSLRENV